MVGECLKNVFYSKLALPEEPIVSIIIFIANQVYAWP